MFFEQGKEERKKKERKKEARRCVYEVHSNYARVSGRLQLTKLTHPIPITQGLLT